MKWNTVEDGYEFRVHLIHGRESGFFKSIKCSLDDFDLYVKIFNNLSKALNSKNFTEDVAAYIAEKTGLTNVEQIISIINPVVTPDIVFNNGQSAEVEYIEVNRYQNGLVHNIPLDLIEFYIKNTASNAVSCQKL